MKLKLDSALVEPFIKAATPVIVKWLATKLAIFSWGPVSWITSIVLNKVIAYGAKALILFARDMKITVDVNMDVKAMEKALSTAHDGRVRSEEETKKVNDDIKNALNNLVTIGR